MATLKIVSYNVNGLRAAISKGFINWLRESNPDIIHIQETKANSLQISTVELKKLGYTNIYFHSAVKKGYSGTATFSKIAADKTVLGMDIEKYDCEGRVIRNDFGDLTLLNCYIPSGTQGGIRQDFKMDFLADFQMFVDKLKEERRDIIISGDYNICHLWIDIHNPDKQQKTSGFLPEERAWFDSFAASGFTDSFRYFNQEPHNYTWWSYRMGARQNNKGWRIDYHWVSNSLTDRLVGASILSDVIHSDHCPVTVEIRI